MPDEAFENGCAERFEARPHHSQPLPSLRRILSRHTLIFDSLSATAGRIAFDNSRRCTKRDSGKFQKILICLLSAGT
ncbi:hypothetical protein TB1_000546 [Malus domestica]